MSNLYGDIIMSLGFCVLVVFLLMVFTNVLYILPSPGCQSLFLRSDAKAAVCPEMKKGWVLNEKIY